MEVTQYKGDSETHPLNSPEDEFAGYEIWDRINLGGMTPQTPQMQPYQYARSALRIGLAQDAALGVNPFKFGLIGSTDAHTGFAAAEENNFWGKSTKGEPAPGRWHESLFDNPDAAGIDAFANRTWPPRATWRCGRARTRARRSSRR